MFMLQKNYLCRHLAVPQTFYFGVYNTVEILQPHNYDSKEEWHVKSHVGL